MKRLLGLCVVTGFAVSVYAQTRIQDVIYLKQGGAAFTMDVFKPAKPNKAAVVFMVSGGWVSDHSMLKSFAPDIEKVLPTQASPCSRECTAPSPDTRLAK